MGEITDIEIIYLYKSSNYSLWYFSMWRLFSLLNNLIFFAQWHHFDMFYGAILRALLHEIKLKSANQKIVFSKNGKPLQYSCLKNPMHSMKRQNDRILKDELPRSVRAQYATGDQCRNNSRKNERIETKQKQYQLWMWLMIEARSDAVKSNIA